MSSTSVSKRFKKQIEKINNVDIFLTEETKRKYFCLSNIRAQRCQTSRLLTAD
jgi:hypothetical protein